VDDRDEARAPDPAAKPHVVFAGTLTGVYRPGGLEGPRDVERLRAQPPALTQGARPRSSSAAPRAATGSPTTVA
jgi:hypothetical protein